MALPTKLRQSQIQEGANVFRGRNRGANLPVPASVKRHRPASRGETGLFGFLILLVVVSAGNLILGSALHLQNFEEIHLQRPDTSSKHSALFGFNSTFQNSVRGFFHPEAAVINSQGIVRGGIREQIEHFAHDHHANIPDITHHIDPGHPDSLEDVLVAAGVDVTKEMKGRLASMKNVIDLYYGREEGKDGVRIVGMDTCRKFRENVDPAEAYIGPAGMFNTGTNLMATYLRRNCFLPKRVEKHGADGMRFQTPWGKHTPVSWRFKNVAEQGGVGVNPTDFLPVVMIKDPYTWMTSMCRHTYAANWLHKEDHCPNLVANDFDANFEEGSVIPVKVRYKAKNVTHHSSLVDLWNTWYLDYVKVDFPRLIVRFEDLLLRPVEVVGKVCECGGGELRKGNFIYKTESAKGGSFSHKDSSGLVAAITKYTNSTERMLAFEDEDLSYAVRNLDEDLIDTFHYFATTKKK